MLESNLTAAEYAKFKLIMAAIKLFGEAGVNSVSLREINRVAGTKNNSALHYHFKNKIGLIEALINFIQSEFDQIRAHNLTNLEAAIKTDDLSIEQVMGTFINAYVTIIRDNTWGYNAVRALARIEFDGDEEVHSILNKSAGTAVRSIFNLLSTLLPDLPPKVLKNRINFSINAVINGFAAHKNLKHSYLGDLSVISLEQLADTYTSMTIAIITEAKQ